MKVPFFLAPVLLLCSCQDEQVDSSQIESGSGVNKSSAVLVASSDLSQKRSITPSNRLIRNEKADTTATNVCISELVMACDAFFEEYQALPLSSSFTTDATQISDNLLMASLVGTQFSRDDNPKFVCFFVYKNTPVGEERDGLLRTENHAELFDPWGNHYHLVLNYDYDNQLRTIVTDEIIFERNLVVWSAGPDVKHGTPETDADNIYSWNTK